MGKQLDAAPKDILKRFEKWLDIALISGPPGLRAIKGFHDEALSGEWKGHRSSRLSIQYRVIYRVVAQSPRAAQRRSSSCSARVHNRQDAAACGLVRGS